MASTYQLLLNGQAADADLYTAVSSLEVEESLDLPGAVQLTVPVGTTATGDLTLRVGQPVPAAGEPGGGGHAGGRVGGGLACRGPGRRRVGPGRRRQRQPRPQCIFDGYMLSLKLHLDSPGPAVPRNSRIKQPIVAVAGSMGGSEPVRYCSAGPCAFPDDPPARGSDRGRPLRGPRRQRETESRIGRCDASAVRQRPRQAARESSGARAARIRSALEPQILAPASHPGSIASSGLRSQGPRDGREGSSASSIEGLGFGSAHADPPI